MHGASAACYQIIILLLCNCISHTAHYNLAATLLFGNYFSFSSHCPKHIVADNEEGELIENFINLMADSKIQPYIRDSLFRL